MKRPSSPVGAEKREPTTETRAPTIGWPDIFRTILHTHHALVHERVDLDDSGRLRSIRDLNGAPFGMPPMQQ